MKKIIQITMGIVLGGLVSGCQQLKSTREEYIRNHEKDYLRSGVLAPLQVPQDLSQIQPNETFPLPENIPDPHTLPHVSLKPPGFGEIS